MAEARRDLMTDIDSAWRPLWEAVEAMHSGDWDRPTPSGWTVKEMVATVAFWDEAAVPVITYMLRGEEIPAESWFGSGFMPPADRDWPPPDEHNAREAEWARGRSGAEVGRRLLLAHVAMVDAAETISEEEAPQRAAYIGEQCDHYREHYAELRAALAG